MMMNAHLDRDDHKQSKKQGDVHLGPGTNPLGPSGRDRTMMPDVLDHDAQHGQTDPKKQGGNGEDGERRKGGRSCPAVCKEPDSAPEAHAGGKNLRRERNYERTRKRVLGCG
jgi:hypothetical protein